MPMPRQDDLSRSLVSLQQDSTLIAVIELSQSSWLVAGIVPGLARHPLKKLEPDQEALLRLLRRWQEEAGRAILPSQASPKPRAAICAPTPLEPGYRAVV